MRCTIYKNTTSRRESIVEEEMWGEKGSLTTRNLHLGLVNMIFLVDKEGRSLIITIF